MGGGRLDGVVKLDVGKLVAADDALLGFGRQRIPAGQIVKIFLHDHVAAAGECRVLRADIDGIVGCLTRGVLRSVDKADQIAVVEIAKAVHFVDRRNRVTELRHDLRRQFEAEIHALGADVKQQVAGRGDRMARAGFDFAERMQFRRPRCAKQSVPRVRSEPHHAGQIAFDIAKAHRADQSGEIAAQRSDGVAACRPGIHRDDQKDRGAGQRLNHHLRDRRQVDIRCGGGQWFGLQRE